MASKESEIVASLIAAHDESYQNGQEDERKRCADIVRDIFVRLQSLGMYEQEQLGFERARALSAILRVK